MGSALFAFVDDLPEAELGQLIGEIRDRYRVDGMTVAAAYHEARDVTPHGRHRLVWRQDGVHFRPDSVLFAGQRLAPPVLEDAATEPFDPLRAAVRERGMALHGWAVFCHNTALGAQFPDCTAETCFGDRASLADLCPAHPDVRAYCVALARNVARLGVDSVVAESLHYGGFAHGYHHERSFVPLGGLDRFLFGLCFCPHCTANAEQRGVDAQQARAECRAALERALGGGAVGPEEVSAQAVREHAGSAVAAYADRRQDVVTDLVSAVSAAVTEEGSRLVLLDHTGAVKGYADGAPTGPPLAQAAWEFGVDPAALGRVVDEYGVLAYVRDERRLVQDLASYRDVCGPDVPLRAVLRPGPPDTDSEAHLADKVVAARDYADAVDFYHYGLNTLADLDRIGVARAGGDGRGTADRRTRG